MTNTPYWLTDDSRKFLSRGYLNEGQTAEERIKEIAENAERLLKVEGFAEKFIRYMYNGWISLASPIWSGFGTEKGLPISCNQVVLDDTTESILYKTAEIGMMSKYGAGTAAYLGLIRPRGSKISVGGVSDGPVRFAELIETTTNVISQGAVRRGSCAVYLDVDHPDIEEFLEIREEGHFIQNLSFGVCVSDEFMKKMIDGDKKSREIWLKILKKRFSTGYPYLFFTDNVNNNKPQVYKDKNLKIYSSQLCNEIELPSSPEESYVCCLSSVNLLHYDDWKETDLIETMTYFLDAVMEEYIQKTESLPFMQAANKFAKKHRAIGLGVIGYHSLLQSKSIAFESFEAKLLNAEIFKLMNEKSLNASKQMATEYGEPEILIGYGERNTTRLALAPTTSSSFIIGSGELSPSIEPNESNFFIADLAKGKFTVKNPHLKKVLQNYEEDTKEVWDDIAKHGGSVQHLEFLTEHEKNVFKTFDEISQMEIVIQATQRQKYIDQGQSLNLKISTNESLKDVNALYIKLWELGGKGAYYQKGTNPSVELKRNLLNCVSCEA